MAAISASDSIKDLTKPEAVGRRSADKARPPKEMAASELADSDAVRTVRVWIGLVVGDWRVTGVGSRQDLRVCGIVVE